MAKTPHCIASVLLLITVSAVYTALYIGSYSLTRMFTYTLKKLGVTVIDQKTSSCDSIDPATPTHTHTHKRVKRGLAFRGDFV